MNCNAKSAPGECGNAADSLSRALGLIYFLSYWSIGRKLMGKEAHIGSASFLISASESYGEGASSINLIANPCPKAKS